MFVRVIVCEYPNLTNPTEATHIKENHHQYMCARATADLHVLAPSGPKVLWIEDYTLASHVKPPGLFEEVSLMG